MSDNLNSRILPNGYLPDGWSLHFASLSAEPVVTAGPCVGLAQNGGRLVLLADSSHLVAADARARAEAVLAKWDSGTPASQLWSEIDGSGTLLLWDGAKRLLFVGCDALGGGRALVRKNGVSLTVANTLAEPMLRQNPFLSVQAVHDYLSLQYVPENTIFCGITRLKGGDFYCCNLVHQQEYTQSWSRIKLEPDETLTEEAAAAHCRELVTAAVRREFEAGKGHAAVLLSGGVDSAIVAGLAATLSDEPLRVYTVGFADPAYDERARAAATAEYLRRATRREIRHEMLEVTPADWPLFCSIVKRYGEPYGDASLLATARLAAWAGEQGETRLLSGDGADEFFGGYERYRFMRLSELVPPLCCARVLASLLPGGAERSFAGRLKRLTAALEHYGRARYLQLVDRFSEAEKQTIYGEWMLSQADTLCPTAHLASSKDPLTRGIAPYQTWDMLHYMPGDVLVKSALAGANAATPVVSPFLDREVRALAQTLPEELKMRRHCRKYLLSRAFPEFVPPELACRRKTGFGVPVSSWLRGPWKKHLEEILLEGPLVANQVILRAPVEAMVTAHTAGKRDFGYELWSLLTLALAWPGQ